MMHPRRDVRVLSIPLIVRVSLFVFAFLLLPTPYSLLPVPLAHAASSLEALPVIIDGKGKPREILRYTVTVKNTGNIVKMVYPWVATIDPAKGELSSSEVDEKGRSDILGSWIELSRAGVAIPIGETREFPVLVQVDVNAKPGVYHALLNFSPGPARAAAESNIDETAAVTLNIEVADDANERLQINAFTPDKNFFTGDTAAFTYRIENIGNRGVVPKGKIHIYDRKGEEVASVDVNEKDTKLEPSTTSELASVWAAGGEFGRYKALLEVDYGRGTLTDTVFFWVMPWGRMLGMFFTLMMVTVIAALLLHARGSARRGAFVTSEPAFAFSGLWRMGAAGVELADRVRDIFPEGEEEEEVLSTQYLVPNEKIPMREEKQTVVLGRRKEVATSSATRLAGPQRMSVPESHQVTLTHPKRPAVDPQNVVNLKK